MNRQRRSRGRSSRNSESRRRRSRSPPRAFAPALAIRTSNRNEQPEEFDPPRAFAPALAIRTSNGNEQAQPEEFKFQRLHNSGPDASWDTLDPETGCYTWPTEIERQSNFTMDEELWSSTTLAPGADPHVVLFDGREVDAKLYSHFKTDSELMEHDCEDEFRRKNPGLAISRTSETIVTKIGDEEVAYHPRVDRRLELVSRQGNGIYADGRNRGLIKKRYYNEFLARADARDDEMVKASSLLQEWESLSEDQKEERRQIARKRKSATVQLLRLEEEEKLPDVYNISPTAVWTRLTRYATRKRPQNTESELFVTDDFETSSSQLTASDASSTGYSRNRSHRTDQISQTSGLLRSSQTITRSTTGHPVEFDNAPELEPFDDVSPTEIEYIDDGVRMTTLIELCRGNEAGDDTGRIIVVSLAHEVRYSAAAVIDRVFGGPLQEVRFLPENRLAVLLFLSPLDAKGFIQHVQACFNNSDHEYRRLQIHASYYKGNSSCAFYEPQEGLLSQVAAKGASRALRVDKISKIEKQVELFEAFKHRFSELYLVRLRLVVPKKRYERDERLSNAIVLEFASIKDAIMAKQQFDSREVSGFESCFASFLADPVGRSPIELDFCACDCCKKPEFVVDLGAGTSMLSKPNSRYRANSEYSGQQSHTSLGSEFLNATRAMRVQDEIYDEEEAARAPNQYGQRLANIFPKNVRKD